MMREDRKLARKARLIPTRVALGPEENGSLIIVQSVNRIPELATKISADLGAD
jgi:hypothetical protein